MAQVNGGQVILNNGQRVTPQQGGWYDGQQFWAGTLSNPQQINALSNQQGAGQQVSNEVVAQTNPANVAYLQQQRPQAPMVPQQQQQAPNTMVGSTGDMGGGGGVGSMSGGAPTFDLIGATNAAYNSPEILAANKAIGEANTEVTVRQQALADVQAGINDNPFYSEATRVGKSTKLTEKANADMMVIQNKAKLAQDKLAMLRADAEIKVGAATGQYNINQQAYKDALSRFNDLLSSGALDNASGSDIANITSSTGMSSSMIQSAISANKKKNTHTSTIQFDDGTNQGFAIIDSDTGEIINKQVVTQSKPKAASTGNTKIQESQATQQNLVGDIQRGVTLRELVNHYGIPGGLTPEEIYRLYNSNSPYGTANESLDDVKQGIYDA